MVESLFILIKFWRMDRGIIWTMQFIDHFPLFFSLFLWMHHMGTSNTAGGVQRFYSPTSPIHWFRCIWHLHCILYHLFHWRDGRPLCGFSSGSSRCGSHTNDWFTSTCSFIFCFFIHRQKFTPIRVHTVSFTIGWYWFFIFTLYIIYYSLCRGSFTVIWEWILLPKILATLLFNDWKGLNSLFHLLYFSMHVYTSSLNVCSPVFVCTFNVTSMIWSGSSHVNRFVRKSQLMFISLAILLNNNIFSILYI